MNKIANNFNHVKKIKWEKSVVSFYVVKRKLRNRI